MNATAKRIILAMVGVLTVWAAADRAEALGPLRDLLLAVASGALLGITAAARIRRRRERQLTKALQRRDERLAQTAHELRTPLTAVISAIEIVRSGIATTPEETKGFLDEADLAARHLSFLIHDVLDVAALDAGRLRLEIGTHPVGELLRDAVRVLGMQATHNEIQVQADPDLAVRADARRLLQVLFNLVGNAIKHSRPRAPIRVQVQPAGNEVLFQVQDEGPGVAEHVRPHLFTPFAGDDQHHRADSTGLGLHICRGLIADMGGRIGYRPRRPHGAEFWFTLPRAPQPAVAPDPVGAQ
ncbi:MAG TPA: hypothetical protein ENI87_05970 [bacterium]|nr:hypothetical protein [bacterium]